MAYREICSFFSSFFGTFWHEYTVQRSVCGVRGPSTDYYYNFVPHAHHTVVCQNGPIHTRKRQSTLFKRRQAFRTCSLFQSCIWRDCGSYGNPILSCKGMTIAVTSGLYRSDRKVKVRLMFSLSLPSQLQPGSFHEIHMEIKAKHIVVVVCKPPNCYCEFGFQRPNHYGVLGGHGFPTYLVESLLVAQRSVIRCMVPPQQDI